MNRMISPPTPILINGLSNKSLNEVKILCNRCVEYSFVSAGFILLLIFSLNQTIPALIPYIALIFYQVAWFIRIIFELLRSIESNKKDICIKSLVITLFNLLCYLMMLLYIQNLIANLIMISIPIFISNLVEVFYAIATPSRCIRLLQNAESFYRWTLLLTVFFIGLKELKLLSWRYLFIIWPIWVFILILFILGVNEFIFAGKLVYAKIKRKNQYKIIIISSWIGIFSNGLGYLIGALFYQITVSIENSNNVQINFEFYLIESKLWTWTF